MNTIDRIIALERRSIDLEAALTIGSFAGFKLNGGGKPCKKCCRSTRHTNGAIDHELLDRYTCEMFHVAISGFGTCRFFFDGKEHDGL